jgi:predicted dehydrogenase
LRGIFAAVPSRTTSRVRIAVVGAGTITQSAHLPALARLADRFQLVAICDLSPSRADVVARRAGAGVRGSSSFEQIVGADDVDAMLLATPGGHAPMASVALAAGKHVLAEKPLCLTIAEADQLTALAARQDRVLQAGYMKMYDPLVRAARRELERLEDVRLIEITVAHPRDETQTGHLRLVGGADVDESVLEAAATAERERTREALGDVPETFGSLYRDVLLGSVVHELSLLRAVGIDVPTRFESAVAWPWPVPVPSVLATATIGSARLVLTWLWLPDYPAYGERLQVLASNGGLTLELAPPYTVDASSTLRIAQADGELHGETTLVAGPESGFVRQLEAFADVIAGRQALLSDAAGAAADTRAIQAIVRTIAAGQGIEVGGEAGARA